jgi:hypothetical protein
VTRVQFNSGTYAPGGTSVVVTLPNPTDSGNMVVVGFTGSSIVTQPGGNPFSLWRSEVDLMGQYLWDKQGAGDNSWTFTQGGGGGHWWVMEILDGVRDVVNGQRGGSGASPTAAVTPAAGDKEIIASIGCIAGTAGAVRTLDALTNSFTELTEGGDPTSDSPMGAVAYLQVTANGSTAYSTTATFSGSTFNQTSIVAAYTTTADAGAATATPAVIAASTSIPTDPTAYPKLTTASQNSGADTTTLNVTIPAVAVGDILVIAPVKDGTGTITWPGSPTFQVGVAQASDSHFMGVRWRRIDGTEGWGAGGSLALTGASEGWAAAVGKVSGAHSSTAPEFASAFNSTGTTTPDAPSLDPTGWATEDTLYLVIYGWDGNSAHSAYPTNYTTAQTTSRWANTAGVGVAMAARRFTAASDNPGTATISVAEEWVAVTVAVRPSAAGANATATPAVIATAVTVPARSTNVSVGPAVVAASAGMSAWAVDVTAAPDSVPATATLPAATALAGGSATRTPAVIAASVALARPGVSVTAAPVAVPATTTLPVRAVNVQARPTVTPVTAALPQATASGGSASTALPAVISATVGLPGPTVTAAQNATVTPGTITATAALPAATRSGTALRQPATVTAAVAIPTPTIQSSGNVTVAPATITATVTVPRPGVGATITADPVTATATLPAATVGSAIVASPATIALTATLPAASASSATVVTVAPVAATVALPAVTVLGHVAPAPSGQLTVVTLTERRSTTSLTSRHTLVTLEED